MLAICINILNHRIQHICQVITNCRWLKSCISWHRRNPTKPGYSVRSIYWYRISVINSMTISPLYMGFEIPKDLCSFQTITVHMYTYDLYRYTTYIYIYINTKKYIQCLCFNTSQKKGTAPATKEVHNKPIPSPQTPPRPSDLWSGSATKTPPA